MSFEKARPSTILPPTEGIRDKVTIQQILFNCITAVNRAATSTSGEMNFDGATDALYQNIPNSVRVKVDGRKKDFLKKEEKLVYRKTCGINMGSKEHPVKDKWGNDYSPYKETEEYLDYKMLFHIIMEELENGKITWSQENVSAENGRVDELTVKIPLQTKESATKYLEKLVEDDMKTGEEYAKFDKESAYYYLCRRITPEIPPPTPTFIEGNMSVETTIEEIEADDKQ
jgi:hypothetical protein